MSISKAVIMGSVVRDPEKRFTANNLPITSFTMNISSTDDNILVRINAIGKLADVAEDKAKKGKVVIVEGRLQTFSYKTNDGSEKRGVEVSAQSIEVVNQAAATADEEAASSEYDSIDFSDEISSDDLIGEDEIPF